MNLSCNGCSAVGFAVSLIFIITQPLLRQKDMNLLSGGRNMMTVFSCPIDKLTSAKYVVIIIIIIIITIIIIIIISNHRRAQKFCCCFLFNINCLVVAMLFFFLIKITNFR